MTVMISCIARDRGNRIRTVTRLPRRGRGDDIPLVSPKNTSGGLTRFDDML